MITQQNLSVRPRHGDRGEAETQKSPCPPCLRGESLRTDTGISKSPSASPHTGSNDATHNIVVSTRSRLPRPRDKRVLRALVVHPVIRFDVHRCRGLLRRQLPFLRRRILHREATQAAVGTVLA